MKNLFCLLLIPLIFSCQNQQKQAVQLNGEFLKWHKITLVINGPETSEWAKENPFLDYKLEATFTNGNKSYTVPGFFAADGNAAETSADEGNVWKINFRPDVAGTWNYKISFRKGKDIVVKEGENRGEPAAGDGMEGSFEVGESDKTGSDFRAKGRIINGGKGYFRFQDSNEIWIKNGADSPENFLAYFDFPTTDTDKLPAAY